MSNELTQHLLLFLKQPVIHLNAAIECQFNNHDDSYQTELLLMNILSHMVRSPIENLINSSGDFKEISLGIDNPQNFFERILYSPVFIKTLLSSSGYVFSDAAPFYKNNQTIFASLYINTPLPYQIIIHPKKLILISPQSTVTFLREGDHFIKDVEIG